MTTWHAVLFAPCSWVRAVLDFIQRKTGTSGTGISSTVTQPPASPDCRGPNENRAPGDGQNLKLGLASTLLSKVHDGLSEHSDEMATFAETLAPADGSASAVLQRRVHVDLRGAERRHQAERQRASERHGRSEENDAPVDRYRPRRVAERVA